MIFDAHTHIFSPDICADRGGWLADGQFRLIYSNARARLVDHRGLLKAMDEGGIDAALVMGFPWERAEFCRSQNEYFRAAAAKSGGRLFPFGSIPFSDDVDVDAWTAEIKGLGLRGVGEIAFYQTGVTDQAAGYFRRVLEAAARYGLPVCLHINEPVGHRYPGKYEPSLGALYEAVAAVPGVAVIFSHWGGGLFLYELMPEVREALSSCWYDTAASPLLYSDDVYRIAAAVAGPGRILFGSDYPLCAPARYMNAITLAFPIESERNGILGENALGFINNS